MRLLLAGFVGIGSLAAAGGSEGAAATTRVFLHALPGPQVERRCLSTLVDAFKKDVGKAKGIEAATSRAHADVVADVKECVVTDSAQTNGVIDLSHGGSELGSVNTVSMSAETGTRRTVGRVTLSVDVDGRSKEFGSGSEGLPIDDAAHAATKPLLEWVASGGHASTR